MHSAGHDFVAMLGRSDLSNIRDQLLIESFDNQGVSSVVNAQGYYIVSASPATPTCSGRDNFYDMLNGGLIEDGVTVEDVRRNIFRRRELRRRTAPGPTARGWCSASPRSPARRGHSSWPSRCASSSSGSPPFITLTAGMLVVVVVVARSS